MGAKRKQSGSGAVERARTEEATVGRNRLVWVASFPPGTLVISGPRAMFLSQSGFVLMTSTAHVATYGHMGAWGLATSCGHLGVWWVNPSVHDVNYALIGLIKKLTGQ